MRNVALRISYLGTAYHGFQRQKNESTVAGTLEKALLKAFSHPVSVIGCGRTDAGVHAETYVINVKTDTGIPLSRMPYAINTFLPPDIVVYEAKGVSPDFHAVFSCIGKEYTYRVYTGPVRCPFHAGRALFRPHSLDIPRMREAAKHFVGTHDFSAMRSVGSNVKTTVRSVEYYEVEERGELVSLRVKANGFLYNMARAMAGTLFYVSEGKILPSDIPGILARGDRKAAGPTVPPEGLYMTGVYYDASVLSFDCRKEGER